MSPFKWIIGIVSNVLVFGILLFLPAGAMDSWRAWVFLGWFSSLRRPAPRA
jgi:hypothetical protein